MRSQIGLSLLAAAAAACGGSSGPVGNSGAPPGSQVLDISMTNSGVSTFAFSPASPMIKVGTMVRWTNNGTVTHTTTSDASVNPAWTSGDLAAPVPGGGYGGGGGTPGGSYSVTFNQAGSYPYHCTYHGAQGMTGTITVTP